MQLTLIQSESPKTITKTYSLKDGVMCKETVANMTKGRANNVQVESVTVFGELLKTINSSQALVFGVTGHKEVGILTKEQLENKGRPAGFISRTKDCFYWPHGAGIMLLDYDPPKQSDKPLSREELLDKLNKVIPLEAVGYVWWTSSSSHIHNSETGEELNGLQGQRVYIAVKDASDIPRAGKALFERLWLNGLGWYEVSKSGALLERSVIDASVWQTNRFDFIGGANCIEPLQQKRGEPLVIEGEPLDTKATIPDLSKEEQAALLTIKKQLKLECSAEVEAVQQHWMVEVADEIKNKASDPDSVDGLSIAKRALTHAALLGDFPIMLEDGDVVTVGQVLDDPATYHGKKTHDPLEPDYEGGKVVGKLYLLSGRPTLHSFAHGGKTYKLIQQPQRIEVIQGRAHDTVNHTLDLLKKMPDVFDSGAQLVGVNNGDMVPFDLHRLTHYLGGVAQYWQAKIGRSGEAYEALLDPPEKVIRQVLSLGEARGLKPLDAVISAPILSPKNVFISKAGYDPETRLFLDYHGERPTLPDAPTKQQVIDAVNRLFIPFERFPFERDIDRSGLFAGILTAVLRPILPTSPAFGFDAPVQGSGKTLLAKCLAVLSTGETPEIWGHVTGQNDDETRKRLFTALRHGKRALVWDNVMGAFDSASIASLLTTSVVSDRVLGVSELSALPNRMLFLATGNNLILKGELPRRFIKVRIDPKSARPYAREFALDPEQYVKGHRHSMVLDALLIVRAWFSSDDFRLKRRANGRTASFEFWDDMVRQPLCWVNREIMAGAYPDVMELFDEAQMSDPEQEVLGSILSGLHGAFGECSFTARSFHEQLKHDADLREAVDELFNQKEPTVRGLGKMLGFRKGRIAQGCRLMEASKDTSNNVQRWKIEVV